MMSQTESFNTAQYASSYENEQFESQIIQWRLLPTVQIFVKMWNGFILIGHAKIGQPLFHSYKSKYEEPTLSEGFAEIVRVNFIPVFQYEEHRTLYYMYLLERWFTELYTTCIC